MIQKGTRDVDFGRIKAQNNVYKALLTKMMVARMEYRRIKWIGVTPGLIPPMQAIDRGLAEFVSYLNCMEHQIKIYENNENYMHHKNGCY